MKRENALLLGILGCLAFAVATATVVWSFAIPNFRPLTIPHMNAGVISVGPMRQQRALSAAEIRTLNDWLQQHRGGWGPLGQTPPSSGDATITLTADRPAGPDGKPVPYVITLWTGISAADWNATLFLEDRPGAVIRIERFPEKDFAVLRQMVDQQPYERTAFP
ncbi:conserved hypothetical protein [Gluconacetobacter diazotrophicus PA1 5]|uniref:Uncharacterized protein n=2 Tax=Gluconacetobacter diazotrophicus TaxID=33996 RepID=A9HJW9_GLUDA|nr:hypothetical protein [Gluconacetobacter diazotrophicus]ACI50043.1 conserved hypothetical protein [Gluconacetobacter diazotrophicus PA1 5]MBB2156263.1 hypothetical protein [Gluconacetobacter diazotrophicus]TWB07877.1 hypothetical protein FBZ86_10967 [Gluconacetobacter diazotrophicus]CAP55965.1 hypothetical protein GDI2022 [Gluconacetobacter diazotrophicus PA1 5]